MGVLHAESSQACRDCAGAKGARQLFSGGVGGGGCLGAASSYMLKLAGACWDVSLQNVSLQKLAHHEDEKLCAMTLPVRLPGGALPDWCRNAAMIAGSACQMDRAHCCPISREPH